MQTRIIMRDAEFLEYNYNKSIFFLNLKIIGEKIDKKVCFLNDKEPVYLYMN